MFSQIPREHFPLRIQDGGCHGDVKDGATCLRFRGVMNGGSGVSKGPGSRLLGLL